MKAMKKESKRNNQTAGWDARDRRVAAMAAGENLA